MKLNKTEGIVFWITGLSGSGKSSIGRLLHRNIKKIYGPTILINGDDIRKLFKINSYDKSSRLILAKKYSNFCKFIVKQKINVIFTVVGLFHEIHKYNKRNLKNYCEIYIKSDIKKIINRKKRLFYRKKSSNVWGLDLKPEYPKNPIITAKNNLKIPLKTLSNQIFKKISKII